MTADHPCRCCDGAQPAGARESAEPSVPVPAAGESGRPPFVGAYDENGNLIIDLTGAEPEEEVGLRIRPIDGQPQNMRTAVRITRTVYELPSGAIYATPWLELGRAETPDISGEPAQAAGDAQ